MIGEFISHIQAKRCFTAHKLHKRLSQDAGFSFESFVSLAFMKITFDMQFQSLCDMVTHGVILIAVSVFSKLKLKVFEIKTNIVSDTKED
jgi:hypothetical protein